METLDFSKLSVEDTLAMMHESRKWLGFSRESIQAIKDFYRKEKGMGCTAYIYDPILNVPIIKVFLGNSKKLYESDLTSVKNRIIREYKEKHFSKLIVNAKKRCKSLGVKFRFTKPIKAKS